VVNNIDGVIGTIKNKDLRGTWSQALITFFAPIFLILIVRWLIVEPFVIPSGSMIPNLLIHDHIAVNKLAFGIHLPFSNQWMIRWGKPTPGDIVVFKFPDNPEVYYIKRLIGLPGDKILVKGLDVYVNGVRWEHQAIETPLDEDGDFDYFVERTNQGHSHLVRFYKNSGTKGSEFKTEVPSGEYFFMGDNRDQSNDGRYWGTVPEKYLVGRAWIVWLSCSQMLESANFACDPLTLRWRRLLKLL